MRIPKFHGTNVIFWIGVVEERDDSKAEDKLKLGRVQVRVLGYHSPKKTEEDAAGEGIPTKDLHWAFPIAPITSASVSGIGTSPLGVVEGSWVFGLSMDGPPMQELYILGTLPGRPTKRLNPNDQGFCDPNDYYPLDDWLNESDLSRLARNESTGKTSLKDKKGRRETSVRTVKGSWSEPSAPYNAQYPYNHVRQSESGHIEEWDDTEGSERINREHKSGTFVEWHPDGSEVKKVIGDGYEIHLKDRNCLIKGTLNITVDGDANIYAKKNLNLKADKNIDINAKGKISLYALKGINITTPRKVTIKGIMGFSAKAVIGRASVASPVNISTGSAKVVG